MPPKQTMAKQKPASGPGKKKLQSSPSKKSGDSKDQKPKKKKKAKMKDLTDEEKAEFKEKKNAAQQEVQRRREELITIFLKRKLVKEELAHRLNETILNDKWRQTMRKMKTDSLRDQAKLSATTFERVSSKKDQIINALMQELEEAEEQQNMVDRAHLSHLGRLLDIHKSRIEALKTEYETERNKMLLTWKSLKGEVTTDFNKATELLMDVKWATEKENKTRMAALVKEFGEKHQSSGLVYTIRLQAEEQMDALNKELDKVLKEYQGQTGHKWDTYATLKKKDEEYQQEFDNQMQEIRDMTETIGAMKKKLETSSKERDELLASLKVAKADYQGELQAAKAKMIDEKQYWEKQTKKVTLETEAVRKRLFECSEQLDRLLKLGSQCRKLEVVDDRAFRFLPSEAEAVLREAAAPEKAEKREIGMNRQNCAVSSLAEGDIATFCEKAGRLLDPMEPFWKQYGRVNLQAAALGKQNQMLKRESELLKDQLRRFFERMRISNHAIDADPTLMPIAKAPIHNDKKLSIMRPKSAFPASGIPGVQQIQPQKVNMQIRAHV